MGSVIKGAKRLVLTWYAFSLIATSVHTFYPGVTNDVNSYVLIVLQLGAVAVAVHAAVRGVPRVRRSFQLAVVMFAWSIVRNEMMKHRIVSPFSGPVLNYASWTVFAAFALGTAYVVVYRLRLLDREGPIGRRVRLV